MASYCGYIALIGRPNVGKSTLLNCILKQKLSITSKRPQTTRHRILGINTVGEHQYVYVDTPGIHQGEKKAINRLMNKTAKSVLRDVDLILFIVERTQWTEKDEFILNSIKHAGLPCILVVNKVDQVADKSQFLPLFEKIRQYHNFVAMIPISAKTGYQVDVLQQEITPYLLEGPHLFYDDQITDRPVRFLCAELLREKIFRFCGQEIPYSASVDIESFIEENNLIRIHALILVERQNHKLIIIGDNGLKLKEIAASARLEMEKLLGKKVFLKCWCKVKSGWSDNERLLKQLGYDF